jgi:hypothetical protein
VVVEGPGGGGMNGRKGRSLLSHDPCDGENERSHELHTHIHTHSHSVNLRLTLLCMPGRESGTPEYVLHEAAGRGPGTGIPGSGLFLSLHRSPRMIPENGTDRPNSSSSRQQKDSTHTIACIFRSLASNCSLTFSSPSSSPSQLLVLPVGRQ